MKLDIEHVLFWMDAVRNSTDRSRTLESFWKGQIKSKVWLIDNLLPVVSSSDKTIVIHGGWNGVLASLIFQTMPFITSVVSIDIDSSCEETAKTMNKIEEMQGKFKALTCNMADYQYDVFPNIVINTSCEHITQETYECWLNNIPLDSLIVLQSNNYFDLDEHIRCAEDLIHFEKQSKIKIISSHVLELPKYKRFMIIGRKDV